MLFAAYSLLLVTAAAPDRDEDAITNLLERELATSSVPPHLRHQLQRGFAQTQSAKVRLANIDLGAKPTRRRRPAMALRRDWRSTVHIAPHHSTPPPTRGATFDIPLANHPLVDTYIDYFTGRGRPVFAKWLARADRYIPLMQPLLAQHGLPLDTVYLAMIESGFSARAYSRAAAAGYWQFIAATGRHYGLRQDTWVDERRDFVKATHAAARYLSALYDEFQDWHLAWAGYNAGAGRIRRALTKHDVSDFWALLEFRGSLAKETQHYVPKLIAAATIAKNREHYGFQRQDVAPVVYEEAPVDAPIELTRIAQKLSVPVDTLRELNPELTYDVTPPQPRYTLRVPPNTAAALEPWLASLPMNQRFTYSHHRIQKGDTLGGIAARFDTTIDAIRDFNKIRNPRRLKLGQDLVVPGRGKSALLASAGRPGTPANATPVRTATRRTAKPRAVYTVTQGDTLWSIALRHGVSVDELRRWNGLRSNRLQIGVRLDIF